MTTAKLTLRTIADHTDIRVGDRIWVTWHLDSNTRFSVVAADGSYCCRPHVERGNATIERLERWVPS
ncbi:hypothetical protein AB0A63_13855 [Lentzea sp. NPDC042327]|uniref:hypothetical protein n=1 Tax=Lentzea sp. NPDC042327 TaxID=3154801 RepID=UPI0033E238CB